MNAPVTVKMRDNRRMMKKQRWPGKKQASGTSTTSPERGSLKKI
nr:hypothetical protein [Citrobacter freundii]